MPNGGQSKLQRPSTLRRKRAKYLGGRVVGELSSLTYIDDMSELSEMKRGYDIKRTWWPEGIDENVSGALLMRKDVTENVIRARLLSPLNGKIDVLMHRCSRVKGLNGK